VSPGAARVLEALRTANGHPCSGEALSARWGVSRAQIWKHVEALRARGYEIRAEPGGGYRLAGVPDRLYPEELRAGLRTRWLAREIHWEESTDSTNRVADALARAGATHGTAVVAEGQTAGRGRLGRSFFSPPHRNLYTSLVLRPELTTSEAPTLILAAGVAVARAVSDFVPDPEAVEIKWPNDVLVGGRKTAGILMELSAEATRVVFAVLGIGVNLNVSREELPEEFRARATSLAAERGAPVDRAAFARRLYESLEDALDRHAEGGLPALSRDLEARFRMAGRRVRVQEPGGRETAGECTGLSADGALLLRGEDGAVLRVVAGDVTLAKEDA